jgi:hypothetical protein
MPTSPAIWPTLRACPSTNSSRICCRFSLARAPSTSCVACSEPSRRQPGRPSVPGDRHGGGTRHAACRGDAGRRYDRRPGGGVAAGAPAGAGRGGVDHQRRRVAGTHVDVAGTVRCGRPGCGRDRPGDRRTGRRVRAAAGPARPRYTGAVNGPPDTTDRRRYRYCSGVARHRRTGPRRPHARPSGRRHRRAGGGWRCRQLVPFTVGMWLRARHPEAAGRVQVLARRIADALLAGIVVWSFVTTRTGWPTYPPPATR